MVNYAPLWETMRKRKVSAYALVEKHGINNYTLTRMRRNMHVSTRTLEDLCGILGCRVQDIVEISKEPP